MTMSASRNLLRGMLKLLSPLTMMPLREPLYSASGPLMLAIAI